MHAGRLFAIARKEAVQLRRDTRSMLLAFALPLLLLVFFGYAITLDVDAVPLAVLDQDRSAASRQLVERLVAGHYFVLEQSLQSHDDAEDVLLRGDAVAVLVIPPDFARVLASGRSAPVQLLVDGSDANTATIALGYADAILAAYAADVTRPNTAAPPSHVLAPTSAGGPPMSGVQAPALVPAARASDPSVGAVPAARTGAAPPLDLRTRIWYNPELASRNMIVPGLVAVIMSIIAALLTSLTIAREWERGTMEQLASTPVRRAEVVIGKLIPYAVIGTIDVAVTIVAGMLLFDVPLRGSVLLLGALTLLFLAGALGLGLFFSAALQSQLLATQAAIMTTFLPAVLLSGFLFDIDSMPVGVRAVTFLIPARYFVTVTRGIFLKGVGLEVLWPDALAMLVFAAVGLGLATRMFRKEVA
jgi:ABC-2 type transport system permease protein